MSQKIEKKARQIARTGYEDKLQDSVDAQMPRWCRVVINFCAGIPTDRALEPYLRHWRQRRRKANDAYVRFSLKALARAARSIMHDSGKAGSHIAGQARSHSA